MSIKPAQVAPIEPVVTAYILAYVARKALVRIWRRENKAKLVTMGWMSKKHWHRRTCQVEINFTSFAVVGKAISLVPTCITIKETIGIRWGWEEGKDMVFVKRVCDLVRGL